MLLEFSVTNFRSIKEKQTLSLLKTKKNELENNWTTITLSTGKTLDVLNSAVIYGANASGKSNVVSALKKMFDIVLHSKSYQPNSAIPVEPFLLSKETINQPTEFELDFIDNGTRFVYGFSATKEKIINEWLYQYPKGRPQVLIERKNTNIWGAMNALNGNKKLWRQSTKDNSLFLTTAIELNCEQLSDLSLYLFLHVGFHLYDNDNFFSLASFSNDEDKVLLFLQQADLGINKVKIVQEKVEHIKDESYRIVHTADGKVGYKAEIYRVMEGDVLMKFDLEQESAGTKKIFALAFHWLDALDNGYTLILDELQNSLHPKLVEYLVQMFHNPEINKKGAQLIFVTHETSLLDQEIFRRDQVWFCEKENNATELFSLADFSVRKGTENVEKFYLSGRYGAVPYLR